MSNRQSTPRVDELSDIFVSVTGADMVIEPQREEVPSDREVSENSQVTVEDGLADAVAGAEIYDSSDPAA